MIHTIFPIFSDFTSDMSVVGDYFSDTYSGIQSEYGRGKHSILDVLLTDFRYLEQIRSVRHVIHSTDITVVLLTFFRLN